MKAKTITYCVIAAAMLLTSALSICAQSPLVIDSFVTPWETGEPLGRAQGPGIIGGQRDVMLGIVSEGLILTMGNGQLIYDSPTAQAGAYLRYEGLADNGLPLADLTGGGLLNAMTLTVFSIRGTWDIQVS